ncbi:CAP domain-containing protein [Zongyangia hominis]|uniref:CAP domain-containing protein n=1 Tax=Zongyangia hominis TaxID=2763677 RepID=A0A926EBJ2_9FIRM|nr:CAP domain-containing protein [Zongyangia hominis]MBC8570763.1 CAP domain-containing protein [Zongyangia hominis]
MKFRIPALVLVLALLLSGCGQAKESSSSSDSTAPPVTTTSTAVTTTTPPVTTTTTPPVTTTTPPPATTTTAPAAAPASSDSDIVSQLFTLVNNERASLGLPGYNYSGALCQSAYTRCVELVSTFSHTRPDGTTGETAALAAGYRFLYFGENIAETDTMTAQQLFDMWKSSAGHYASMTASYFSDMGAAVYEHNGILYGVLHFAQPGGSGEMEYHVEYEGEIIDYNG